MAEDTAEGMAEQSRADPVDRIVAQWRRERLDLDASPMAVSLLAVTSPLLLSRPATLAMISLIFSSTFSLAWLLR